MLCAVLCCLQLRELWAEYNRLSGSLPEAYYKLGKLQKLVLNNNSLQGGVERRVLMYEHKVWGAATHLYPFRQKC